MGSDQFHQRNLNAKKCTFHTLPRRLKCASIIISTVDLLHLVGLQAALAMQAHLAHISLRMQNLHHFNRCQKQCRHSGHLLGYGICALRCFGIAGEFGRISLLCKNYQHSHFGSLSGDGLSAVQTSVLPFRSTTCLH